MPLPLAFVTHDTASIDGAVRVGAPRKRAYFMLSHNDIASPNFATQFAPYDLFVSPKELTAEDIDRVHTLLPGARVLAYYGFSYVVVPGQCSPNCTDTPARCNMTV